MQNKINQKVPIAKMDELITAIRESGGGGGSKLYLHVYPITSKTLDDSGFTVTFYSYSSTRYSVDDLFTIITSRKLTVVGTWRFESDNFCSPIVGIDSTSSQIYIQCMEKDFSTTRSINFTRDTWNSSVSTYGRVTEVS